MAAEKDKAMDITTESPVWATVTRDTDTNRLDFFGSDGQRLTLGGRGSRITPDAIDDLPEHFRAAFDSLVEGIAFERLGITERHSRGATTDAIPALRAEIASLKAEVAALQAQLPSIIMQTLVTARHRGVRS